MFEAGLLYKSSLYFIGSKIDLQGEGKTTFDLKIADLDSITKIKRDFFVTKEGICRLDGFAILEGKGTSYLLLSITAMEMGQFLEMYEIPK